MGCSAVGLVCLHLLDSLVIVHLAWFCLDGLLFLLSQQLFVLPRETQLLRIQGSDQIAKGLRLLHNNRFLALTLSERASSILVAGRVERHDH